MIPITFVRLENYPGFLCSYDGVKWWKTEPLPGSIDTVIDVAWIWGEYNIVAARMTDGTYSVFQSYHEIDDSLGDIRWRSVLNTAERIKCMIRPDYGRALIGTSGGWWRSENSGTDWTKVSSQAPNCFCVKELTNDILVALDGTYIWRSVDSGTNWTKSVVNGTATPVIATTIYPTIDGTVTDIIVGCTSTNIYHGVFPTMVYYNNSALLIYSDDAAVSFKDCDQQCTWWYREYVTQNMDQGGYKYPNMRDVWTDVITDVEMTSVMSNGLPTFVVQVKRKDGILRHYYLERIYGTDGRIHPPYYYIMFLVYPKFDAVSSLSNSLVSEEIQITGSDLFQKSVMFSGSDGTGTTPMLMKSIDGGITWVKTTTDNVDVYTSNDLDVLATNNNPFLNDSYIQYSWEHLTCHNNWHPVSTHLDKRQSYDIAASIKNPWTDTTSYDADGWIRGKNIGTYWFGSAVVIDKSKTYSVDYHCGKFIGKTYDVDGLAGGKDRIRYYIGSYINGLLTSSYQANVIIIKDEFPVFDIIQALNIRPPHSSESVYPPDSRLE